MRLQLRSMAQTEGLIDSSRFLDDYVRFMTTPNSHNDVYAGVSRSTLSHLLAPPSCRGQG